MRAYVRLALVISEDDALEATRFDNRDAPYALDDALLANGTGGGILVVADNVYHRFSFGGVRPTWLFITTDQNITIRLNSTDGLSGTEIPVDAIQQTVPAPTPGQLLPPQKGALFLHGLLGAGFDLWIRNSTYGSSAPLTANVTVAFAG